MKYKSQIEQKIKYIGYHLDQIKSITNEPNEDEILLFANIHAFFWECRSILELIAQEIYDKTGDGPKHPHFFGSYKKHLKGKIQYTDQRMVEYKNDTENSLLFYLNEYRNAISHRETPGKSISVVIPGGEIKFKPHKFNKTTDLFDTPWNNMTWDKLLSGILEMTIKIKDECLNFISQHI